MNRRAFLGMALAGTAATACNRRTREATPAASTPSDATNATSLPAPSPTATEVVTTATSALPHSKIEPWAAADFAELDAFAGATGSRAMMILEAGTVVHEWYRDGDPAFARDVASAQKSVLSLIVGRAIDLDVLSLESTIDSVLGSGWATGESATITVEHLLTMTSGLDDLWRVVDEPGRAWRYNSAFAALFDVIESVTARPLNDVAAEWLFEPIGAAGAEFRVRPGAAARARYGLVCTAGQLAAVGAMVLGSGPQQVSRAWLDGSFLPSQPFNPAYGRLWWLNGQSSYLVPEGVEFDGPLVPSAPPDMVAALGKDDQKLYVCPSLDLVVVRLGAKADPDARLALSSFDDDLWQQLIAQRLRAR